MKSFHFTGSFLTQLHAKLILFDSEELKRQTLTAIRQIASHNPEIAVESLLRSHDLPFDDAVVRIWKSFATETQLASSVMKLILDTLCPFMVGKQLEENQVQSPFENQTVQFSNGKIGHLVFKHLKIGPVFRPQYIGKAN